MTSSMSRRELVALGAGLLGGSALSEAVTRHASPWVNPVQRFQAPSIPQVLMPTRWTRAPTTTSRAAPSARRDHPWAADDDLGL